MADYVKTTKDGLGFDDNIRSSGFYFVLEDDIIVLSDGNGDGRTDKKIINENISIVYPEDDNRTKEKILNEPLTVNSNDSAIVSVVYEGLVGIYLDSGLNYTEHDLRTLDTETYIVVYDDGTIELPESLSVDGIGFSENVSIISRPHFEVRNIKGTYYGRVPIDVRLKGSGWVNVSIHYFVNGVWKKATITDNIGLTASSSSSSFSLSSSSSSSSSESFSSSSVSSSSDSLSSSSESLSSQSCSSISSSSLSSSSCSASDSSISTSSSSTDQEIVSHRIWWESGYDLYEGITTKLKVSVDGSEIFYITDVFTVDLDVPEMQFPLFKINNGETLITNNVLTMSFVAINPVGYKVEEVKFSTSQYHNYDDNVKDELFTNVIFEGTFFDVNHVRLIGDLPFKINSESLVVDESLVFSMHMNSDRDWINNQLTRVSGNYIDDIYGGLEQALYFASSNEKVDLLPNEYLDLDGVYTVVSWFEYPLESTSTWNSLICGSSKHHPIIVRRSDFNLGYYDDDKDVFLSCEYQMSQLSSGWHCLAVTADGYKSEYYIDGKYVGYVKNVSNQDIRSIGNSTEGSQQWGKLDEFRLYNRKLELFEIKLLYNGGQYENQGQCSGIIDAGSNVEWKNFDNKFYVPSGTNLNFYARTSLNENGVDGLVSKKWRSITKGDIELKYGRYLEWKAEFQSNEISNLSPRLYYMNFYYDNLSYLHEENWRSIYPVSFRYDTYSDWRDCTWCDVSIDDIPGNVLIESYEDGGIQYQSSGFLMSIVDAGRDVDWGYFESFIEDYGYSNVVCYYFRSATNNEGVFALSNKYFVLASSNSIPLSNGRYLEWKIVLNKTPNDLSPILYDFTIWCWDKKRFYNTEDDWNGATRDENIEIDSIGEVKLSYSDEFASSGEIHSYVDAGMDIEWQYWLIYDSIEEDTDIKYFYRHASESEGIESLSSKPWNEMDKITNISGLTSRYMAWRAILESDGNNTPKLKKFIFSWNDNELESFQTSAITSSALGKLITQSNGRDIVHSYYDFSRELEKFVIVDEDVTQVGGVPIFTWTNADDADVPRQNFSYVFQLMDDEQINFCENVYEYVKSSTSELNDYQWKHDSIVIMDDKVVLDDSIVDNGWIVYRLTNDDFRVWKGFKINDNCYLGDNSKSISYSIRYSDDLIIWTDWKEISSIDNLCHKSKHVELRIKLNKKYGSVVPEFYDFSIESFDGIYSHVVEEENTTTSFDCGMFDNLSAGNYYYRVRAYDGLNFSAWSRMHAVEVILEDIPDAPTSLTVDGIIKNERVISFSPNFDWIFNHSGHAQSYARVQVGTESGLWNMWDSGKASTSDGLEYGQEVSEEELESVNLQRNKNYYWRVRVWNELDKASNYSQVGSYRLNQLPTIPRLHDVI